MFEVSTHIQIQHLRTDRFPKITFLDSGDFKAWKSVENSISDFLTEYITSITYCNRIMKSKK